MIVVLNPEARSIHQVALDPEEIESVVGVANDTGSVINLRSGRQQFIKGLSPWELIERLQEITGGRS